MRTVLMKVAALAFRIPIRSYELAGRAAAGYASLVPNSYKEL